MADLDALEMSDEDFLNAPMPTDAPAVAQVAEVEDESQHDATDDQNDGDNDAATGTDPDEAADPAAAKGDPASTDTTNPLAEADEPGAGTATGKSPEGKEQKTGTEKTTSPAVTDDKAGKEEAKPAGTEPVIDYKVEYEKLLAPFKANGRDFTVKSVDDAKALMQMGANYSKKMQALKPNLKLLKTLESAGLLSQEKISYMIDLMGNAPGAVNKLIKESGIDPMDLDAEKAGEYKQATYDVSDAEMDLDEVMEDLKDSPKVGELITLVTKELDHASKSEIQKEPGILRVLDSHMNSGVYGVIMAELQNEVTLGRLKNVPMLKAYKQIGDAIQERGGFNHLFQGSTQEKKEIPAAPKVVEPPKSPKANDDTLNAKRRAASSNRPVVTNNSKTGPGKDFDPLNMSDADFAKLGI
jgi:hypothetical protein